MEIEVLQDGSSKYLHIPGEVLDKLNWDIGDILKPIREGDTLVLKRVLTSEEKEDLKILEESFDRNSGIGSYLDSGF
jgi:bifunctional DNA-binding transcriptional regulator/antitoxin component of YhaV-PrlF toxin-antitoxin module